MNQPLYIAIDKKTYVQSKAGILASEIAILNSMKHLYAIRQTHLQKKELRKKIMDAFNFIKIKMESLKSEKLPEVGDVPKKEFKKESIKFSKASQQENQENEEQHKHKETIEEELLNIQRKLEMLNST